MAWGQILTRTKKAEEKLIRKAFRAGYKRGREDERTRILNILDRVTANNKFPSAQSRALANALRKRIVELRPEK